MSFTGSFTAPEARVAAMLCSVLRAATLPLEAAPLDPEQVVAGDPQVRALDLLADVLPPGLTVGIWEHGPGVSTDVEADEVFVVLSGRATVDVEAGPVLELGPGDLCTLAAGARTRWTVHETLRKVYVGIPTSPVV